MGRRGRRPREATAGNVRACGGYLTVGLSLLAAIKSVAAVGSK